MPTYLEQWNDPTVKTTTDFDWDAYAQEQANRLMRASIIAREASEFKRRRGADAEREDLASDKKMAKRVAAATRQIAEQWGAEAEDFDEYATAHHEELMRLAAQIDWPKYVEETKTYTQKNLALVATTAIRNGENKIGNKFANRLLNEANIINNAWIRTQKRYEMASKKSSKTAKKS